ncbi:MAG: CHRD domain-containing protein [Fulvivirga sp.]|uniref:CHRD domain-containing protein n=1 Tax=Fulvivirga sp. TaxID=1931237 RepID=UPI0032EE894B
MKNLRFISYLLALTAFVLVSCDDDDNDGPGVLPTGQSKTFALSSVADPAISGTATFNALDNGSTSIELMLNGTPDGGSHPAHIHFNTAAEGGDIAVSLTSVDGSTGMSTTIVSATDAGDPLTYYDLLDFDGYINVHFSADDLATLVAQGDIGQNELTGMSKDFALASVADPNISGTAMFYERVNGETLVTLALENTPAEGMHPAHIHFNTAAEGGGIAVTLGIVDGNTGMSKTNVSMLDDGSMMLKYDDLLDFDGYINVHLSADDLATLVAQGDIGQNELTGMSMSYDLNEVDVAGVSGTVDFRERVNGETLVEINLTGTTFAGDHPTHIHLGSVAEAPGAIAVTLTSVNAMGVSKSNVTILDDGSAMLSYSDLVAFDGYINVHNSAADLGTLVAQGDIGANGN